MNVMMLALLQGRLRGQLKSDAAHERSQAHRALDAIRRGRYGLCCTCEAELEVDHLLLAPDRLNCHRCEAEHFLDGVAGETLDAYTVEAWKYQAPRPPGSPAGPTRSTA